MICLLSGVDMFAFQSRLLWMTFSFIVFDDNVQVTMVASVGWRSFLVSRDDYQTFSCVAGHSTSVRRSRAQNIVGSKQSNKE